MKKNSILKIFSNSVLISLMFLSSCAGKANYVSYDESDDIILVNEDYNQLSSPKNVSFNAAHLYLTWDEVPGASYYDVNIDGQEVMKEFMKKYA